MKSLLRNTSFIFGANVFSLMAGLAVNALYARYLGPSGLGWYTLAIYFPEMVALFLNLGIHLANIYLIGSGEVRAQAAFSSSMGMAVLLSGLAGPLYIACLPWLQPTVLKDMPWGLAVLGSLALPLVLSTTFAVSVLQAQERLKEFSLVKVGQGLLGLGLILVFVVGLHLGLWGALLGYLLAGTGGLAAIFYLLSPALRLTLALDPDTLKKQLSFGLKGHLGSVVQFCNYRLDILLVAYFLSPREVGLYSLATLVAEALWQVAHAAQTALFPRVATVREGTEVTLQVLTGVVALTALGALVLLLVGRPLMTLFFSQAFTESYGAMVCLLPGILMLCYGKILSVDLVGRGYAWAGTIASAAALPFTLGLNLVLIPRLGINGAALASSLSYAVGALVLTVLFSRYCRVLWTSLLVPLNPWDWGRLILRLCRQSG